MPTTTASTTTGSEAEAEQQQQAQKKQNTKKISIIVTGASRGLGRAIAIAFAEAIAQQQHDDTTNNEKLTCTMVLVARSSMDETVQSVQDQIMTATMSSNAGKKEEDEHPQPPQITIHKVQADLSDLSILDTTLNEIIFSYIPPVDDDNINNNNNHHVILINNAGSLCPIGSVVCVDDTASPNLQDVQSNIDLNVTSALWTSSQFACRFAASTSTTTATIVNISSLVAIQPFPTLGLYSAGKAARNAYHTAMAKERMMDHPNHLRILNYAPGPLETDMTEEIRCNIDKLDESLRPNYQQQLVDPMDSARVLVDLVMREESFTSGQHLDYFDIVSPPPPPTADDDEGT